eukprot:CAMPEP_0172084224 /NCGR_PEP_ID=MMETSP1043-20130122/20875_1 /TAXON_ID=464988 /ORGANISM="Hemiselmis andersenii, Strain CCMP441" /LENGTH=95 /DNA_ID=CAMNT_0012746025 /DNA_START=44 /DNA_END=331 /DNA_ORIENTATION=+
MTPDPPSAGSNLGIMMSLFDDEAMSSFGASSSPAEPLGGVDALYDDCTIAFSESNRLRCSMRAVGEFMPPFATTPSNCVFGGGAWAAVSESNLRR